MLAAFIALPGATLVTGRSKVIPPYFVGHWVEVRDGATGALEGTWRVASIGVDVFRGSGHRDEEVGLYDADGDQPYTIVTSNTMSTDVTTPYNNLPVDDISVTNTDNDASGITVSPASGLATSEAGGTATFSVMLTAQPTADVTMGVSSSDTTEGTVAPASLTFTTANWSTPQTVVSKRAASVRAALSRS